MKNLIIIVFIVGLFGLYQACSSPSSSGDGDGGSGTTSSSTAIFGTSLLDSSNFGD